MIDRLLVFSNPDVQKILKEEFIPVTADDWYQRRRQDAEGEFFRRVADQSPRKGKGGSTRQGHYVFTAGGKLLGYNNNRGADRRLAMIRQALQKWQALPAAERTAKIEALAKPDPKYHRVLPKEASVIKVYSRALEEHNGQLKAMSQQKTGSLTAVDHLWLKKEEVSQLQTLVKNGGGKLPEWFGIRLARYYLVDGTRGEPPFWNRDDIKRLSLNIGKTGKITGDFHLETKDGTRGFQGRGHGRIQFTGQGSLRSFNVLITGKHWGEGRYTKGARPGKTPLGFVFQLSDGKKAQDTIPPQAIRWEKGYWEAHK